MMSDMKKAATAVNCECGEWSGVTCEWSGPMSATVLVEHMPAYLRASHRDAENVGSYPHNGASRVRVSKSCAEHMVVTDGEWCREVEPTAPKEVTARIEYTTDSRRGGNPTRRAKEITASESAIADRIEREVTRLLDRGAYNIETKIERATFGEVQ